MLGGTGYQPVPVRQLAERNEECARILVHPCPRVASPPFRPAGCRTAQAGSLCYPPRSVWQWCYGKDRGTEVTDSSRAPVLLGGEFIHEFGQGGDALLERVHFLRFLL